MASKTFVGLDIHRETVVATALNSAGARIGQATFGPSRKELTRFLQELPGDEKHVVMEACLMWEAYFDAAEAAATSVTLSNPLKTRMIAEATIKTDKVDSATLATLLRIDAVPTSFAPPAEIRELRHLVRDRLFYRRKVTMVMNHAYAEMISRGVPYEQGFLKLVKGRRHARSLGIDSVERAVDTIEYLLDKTRELDRAVHVMFEGSKEAQLLSGIPGIGELAAVTLVAFLTPIERFANVDRVSSYAGLAPTTHQSGGTCYQGKLKRDSNHLLQTLLVEIAWTHRRELKRGDVARVARRVGRRRGTGKGSVAGAHKLLKIIYAVLKRGTPFTPYAPERPAAISALRNPRMAAKQCVRGTSLEPAAAYGLLAQ